MFPFGRRFIFRGNGSSGREGSFRGTSQDVEISIFNLGASLPSGWSLSRTSSGSYQTNSSSVEIVDKNVPRFENLGNGSGSALLLENTAINLVRAWCEANNVYDLSTPLSSRVEITGNIVNDPSGRLSGTIIHHTGGTPSTAVGTQQVVLNDLRNMPVVLSTFIKQAPNTAVQLTGSQMIFDLQNGPSQVKFFTNADVVDWNRFQAFTIRSGSTFCQLYYVNAVAGNSGSNLYVAAKQIERNSSYATSIIFANTTLAQRDPDYLSASKATLPAWLSIPNQIGATFSIRGLWQTNELSRSVTGANDLGWKRTICQWDTNYHLALFATSSQAAIHLFSGATTVVSSSHFTVSSGSFFDVEIVQKSNSASIQIANARSGNGTFSAPMLGTLNVANSVYVGCYSGSVSGNLDGAIRNISKSDRSL